ncbi:TetR family transcriptional regulator [Streptomyces sp. NPDC056937]|uniref:TetR family transcriptional regulator n=1 Tax=Streptomyces sp. NPDC056937 TaxID=3345969 RepID=UPI0036310BCC
MVKQDRAARTRQSLIRAGAEVYAREGFAPASLSVISRRAGVSNGALHFHFHFASKRALARAVGDEAARTVRRIAADASGAGGGALQALVDATHELMGRLADGIVVRAGFGLGGDLAREESPGLGREVGAVDRGHPAAGGAGGRAGRRGVAGRRRARHPGGDRGLRGPRRRGRGVAVGTEGHGLLGPGAAGTGGPVAPGTGPPLTGPRPRRRHPDAPRPPGGQRLTARPPGGQCRPGRSSGGRRRPACSPGGGRRAGRPPGGRCCPAARPPGRSRRTALSSRWTVPYRLFSWRRPPYRPVLPADGAVPPVLLAEAAVPPVHPADGAVPPVLPAEAAVPPCPLGGRRLTARPPSGGRRTALSSRWTAPHRPSAGWGPLCRPFSRRRVPSGLFFRRTVLCRRLFFRRGGCAGAGARRGVRVPGPGPHNKKQRGRFDIDKPSVLFFTRGTPEC